MESFLGLDFNTWWFLVLGALFSGYAVLDGFDLGAGGWHLFLKKDNSRRIALNAVGPVWDGNEVWLVIGGGALFAGFPIIYASLLSAMYIPIILFLVFLIMRAVSIEFRSKEPMRWWRTTFDISYSVSSIAIGFLLGVVLGNVLKGMPINEHLEIEARFWEFLNPYALMVGITTVALFMMHGSIYLAMKTEGKIFDKVNIFIKRSIFAFICCFVVLSVLTLFTVEHLYDRILSYPIAAVLPIFALLAILNIPRLISKKMYFPAFLFSCISICLLLLLVSFELYPVVIPSTSGTEGLTIYNTASSTRALKNLLLIAGIGMPLVIFYTVFVYITFRGKVQLDEMSY